MLEKIGLSKLVPGEGDFSKGAGARTFDVPGFGTVGLQLCYEIIFSGRVIDESHRPSVLFNPSNDAVWQWGPPQHFARPGCERSKRVCRSFAPHRPAYRGVIASDGSIVLDAASERGRRARCADSSTAASDAVRPIGALGESPILGLLLIAGSWLAARKAR